MIIITEGKCIHHAEAFGLKEINSTCKYYNMILLIGTLSLKKTFYAICSTSFDTLTQPKFRIC
jgi:hypothetical protein